MKENKRSKIKTPVDPGVFADIMPDGAEMYTFPELPVAKFEKAGIEYTVTDLRLLHPLGVEALNMVIGDMCNKPGIRESEIMVDKRIDDYTIDIICAIVTEFDIYALKKGKNGWSISCRLVSAMTIEEMEDGSHKLTFGVEEDTAQDIYELVREKGKEKVELSELVEAVTHGKLLMIEMAAMDDVMGFDGKKEGKLRDRQGGTPSSGADAPPSPRGGRLGMG